MVVVLQSYGTPNSIGPRLDLGRQFPRYVYRFYTIGELPEGHDRKPERKIFREEFRRPDIVSMMLV